MTLESQGNFCAQSAPCWSPLGGEGLRKLYIRTMWGGEKDAENGWSFHPFKNWRLGALNRTEGHQRLVLPVQNGKTVEKKTSERIRF